MHMSRSMPLCLEVPGCISGWKLNSMLLMSLLDKCNAKKLVIVIMGQMHTSKLLQLSPGALHCICPQVPGWYQTPVPEATCNCPGSQGLALSGGPNVRPPLGVFKASGPVANWWRRCLCCHVGKLQAALALIAKQSAEVRILPGPPFRSWNYWDKCETC